MPPGQGTGKKGGSAIFRQRSRNTTPSSVGAAAAAAAAAAAPSPAPATASLPEITTQELQYLELKFEVFDNLTYDDLVDAGAGSGSTLPDYKAVDGIISRLKRLQGISDDRGSSYDRGMRLLSQSRRARMEEQAAADRSREEEQMQRNGGAGGDDDHQRRANKKKRKAPSGAEGNSQESQGKRAGSMDVDDKKDASASKKDGGDGKKDSESEEESSEDEGAPPPRPVPQNQTFGEDPSTFPDPTVYEIRDVTPGMTVDEIKEIYSVASYPPSDLADLIAGNPPDKDFSSAKPSNQISFSTFSAYMEPYFRAFTEEDLAFLRERGNRVAPFSMPQRGKRHYSEIWAEEDGAMAIDSGAGAAGDKKHLPPNQSRGTIEGMNDDVGETDRLSVGPLLARLLSAMRPEHRPPEANSGAGGGDTSMNGDVSMNGDLNESQNNNGDNERSMPPATFMPESASESWKKATHPKLEYKQVDERLKQELRHIGFLPFPDPSSANGSANGANGSGSANGSGAGANSGSNANGASGGGNNNSNGASNGANGSANGNGSSNANSSDVVDPALAADYNGHFDDEIAARLRRLQTGLREQMLVNGARKARLAELVKERMAYQEYQTILEDLDGQVNAAYLKRTRTMGKSKKGKRPGGAAGAAAGASGGAGGAAGMARPGIGDMTRTLMERRKRWMENIGTVFDDERLQRVPRSADPGSSIFQPAEMAGLIKKEKAAWDEEVDEE
ncbi:Transcriptional regulator [Sporothrix bragantina]|uniref:Transcriptional regulator n=1 Tax=Sporothrix bragantina TaxID=671064 RepID=A0ABP0AXU6_9PEZI